MEENKTLEELEEERQLLGRGRNREKKTAFHGGFSYLERIDGLLRALDGISIPQATELSTYGGLTLLQHRQRVMILKKLFHELYPKIKNPDERKHHLEAERIVEHNAHEAFVIMERRRNLSAGYLKCFDEWERELRDVVENKGLLMPSSKDGLDAANVK